MADDIYSWTPNLKLPETSQPSQAGSDIYSWTPSNLEQPLSADEYAQRSQAAGLAAQRQPEEHAKILQEKGYSPQAQKLLNQQYQQGVIQARMKEIAPAPILEDMSLGNLKRTAQDVGRQMKERGILFRSWGVNAQKDQAEAQKRVQDGTATQQDLYTLANAQRSAQEEQGLKQAGIAGEVIGGLRSAPAIVGEFMAGGAVAKMAGVGQAARVSLGGQLASNAGRMAAITPLVPSMYMDAARQKNIENGRPADSWEGLPPALLHSYAQMLVLGQVFRGAATPGVAAGVKSALTKGATGAVEMGIADSATNFADNFIPQAYKISTGHGTFEHLMTRDVGPAMRKFAVDALTLSAFAGLHSIADGVEMGEANKTALTNLEAAAKDMSVLKGMGLSQNAAAAKAGELLSSLGRKVAAGEPITGEETIAGRPSKLAEAMKTPETEAPKDDYARYTTQELTDIARSPTLGGATELGRNSKRETLVKWLEKRKITPDTLDKIPGFGKPLEAPGVAPAKGTAPPAETPSGGEIGQPERSGGLVQPVSPVHEAALRQIADHPTLSPSQKSEFSTAVGKAFSSLPEAAHSAVGQNMKGMKFYGTPQEAAIGNLEAQLARPDLDPAKRAFLNRNLERYKGGDVQAVGGYDGETVHIDGSLGERAATAPHDVRGEYTSDKIAAHELGHAIDGPNNTLSKSMEWRMAWGPEIQSRGMEPTLTKYATQSAQEGFAEFARLVYSSDVATTQIAKEFPKSSQFFKDRGLWQAERTGKATEAGELFDKRIPTGKNPAAHLDVREGTTAPLKQAPVAERRTEGPPQKQLGSLEAGEIPKGQTALANAVTDQERAANGLPPIMAAARLANIEVWDRAMVAIDRDPTVETKLVDELAAKPRSTTIEENAILLHRRATLSIEHNRAVRVANEALARNAPVEEQDALATRAQTYLAEIDRLDGVIKKTGTEWGRAGQFRRQLVREDYNLSTMLGRMQIAKGAPLTPEETAEVTRMHDEVKAADEKLAALEAGSGPGEGPGAGPGKGPGEASGKGVELADARIEARVKRRAFAERLSDVRFEKLPTHQKIIHGIKESFNSVRSLITSMDLSAVFRQGGFSVFSHPILAAKAIPEMLRSLRSEQGFERAWDALKQRGNALLYDQSGLYLADRSGPLTAQEEAFMGKWLRKIPGIAASERAYTGFLNRIRADVFDSMVDSLKRNATPTPEEAAAVANFVNVSTGRGKLGQTLDRAAVPLAQMFFSPRYVVSRFQLLAGQPLYGGTARTRKLVAQEYARALAGLGLFYAIASMDDDAKLTFDPRSSDFGKVKFGNTRIDPLAGLAQTAVFVTRMTSGETRNSKGKLIPLRDENRYEATGKVPYAGDTVGDVIGRFARSKLAPVPGAAMDVLVGKNVVGEPTTAASTAGHLTVPMSVKDVYKSLEDQGVPRGAAISLLAILGMGAQTYEPGKKKGAKETTLEQFLR